MLTDGKPPADEATEASGVSECDRNRLGIKRAIHENLEAVQARISGKRSLPRGELATDTENSQRRNPTLTI